MAEWAIRMVTPIPIGKYKGCLAWVRLWETNKGGGGEAQGSARFVRRQVPSVGEMGRRNEGQHQANKDGLRRRHPKWMKQQDKPNMVWRVLKALYGSPQAGGRWAATIRFHPRWHTTKGNFRLRDFASHTKARWKYSVASNLKG
eukprot:g41198.t1